MIRLNRSKVHCYLKENAVGITGVQLRTFGQYNLWEVNKGDLSKEARWSPGERILLTRVFLTMKPQYYLREFK